MTHWEIDEADDATQVASNGHEVQPRVLPQFSFERIGRTREALQKLNPAPRWPEQSRSRIGVGVLCLAGMGGSGNVARDAIRALAEAGYPTHLFTSEQTFWRDTNQRRVTVHAVDVPQSPRDPDPAWIEPLTRQIVDLVKKNRIRILNVHYVGGLLEAAVAAKKLLASEGYRLSIAATLHGTDVTNFGRNPAHAANLKAQLAECDAITAVSHWLAAQAVNILDLEFSPTVIENSVDTHRFHPGQWSNLRQRIAPQGEVILCHVSNMRAVKRPLDAVDTLAQVRKGGVAARLLLVGDGPMMKDILQRATELGVEDHIVCPGPLPPDKLARFVAASDIMLVTSETESFCLAAMEAMACGVPVVGTHCGGLDEIMSRVDPGPSRASRLLVNVGDTKSMASTCVDLLTDQRRYRNVQRQGLEVSLERYPKDRQAAAYVSLIDDLKPRPGEERASSKGLERSHRRPHFEQHERNVSRSCE